MMLDLVVGQLGRRRGRTLLTILGVAIGITLVTTLSSFSEGINSLVNSELALLSGKIVITAEGASFESFITSEVDASVLDDVRGLSGIERATGVLGGTTPAGSVFGINMEDLDLFNLDVDIKDGRLPEDGEDEVMLGSVFADGTDWKVGDEIEIRGKKYDIVGEIGRTGVEADYGMITSVETGQEILRKADKLTAVIAKPASAEESEAIARDIENSFSGISALSDKDAARSAQEFTGQMSVMTFAIGSISAFIAGIGIMNVMFMSVRERRKEIGVMKALGANTNEILLQVIAEAIIITLIGEAIGLLISYGIVGGIGTVSGRMQLTPEITPGLVVSVTVFAILLGIFSGLLPAREASKLQPAVVLRYE
jgi:putative ABC transport system permease protein